MNKRIEQCLYQSGLTAQGCWDELDDYAKQGIEKFAELIIRDCLAMCLTSIGNGDYNRGRMDCHDNIREHFGVKQ